jgi:predicted phage replisome organizer
MARYYWLKLPRDFFKRHDVRILESMPDGKAYVLLYIKMLAESVDHDGALRFSDTIPYTADMIAALTETDKETTAAALDAMKSLNLITIDDDGTIILPYAGKQLDSAADNYNAQKQARYRERLKENGADALPKTVTPVTDVLPNEVTSVTDLLPTVTDALPNVTERGNKAVTKNNKSKSKSKSIESEIDIDIVGVKTPASATRQPARARFVPPSPDEILNYMTEYAFKKGLDADPVIEAEKFFNHFTANGWLVGGRSKMRDWHAAAGNWLLNAKTYKAPAGNTNPFGDLLGGSE